MMPKFSMEPAILHGDKGERTSRKTSAACAALTRHFANTEKDKHIAVLTNAGSLFLGIGLPSLALEYLLQNNSLLLGRIMQAVGIEGTLKSAFCLEMGRWFCELDGMVVLLEGESKLGYELAKSVLWEEYWDRLSYFSCDSVDDWQRFLGKTVHWCRQLMSKGVDDIEATGKTWPAIWIIDSITGKSMLSSQTKIEEAGYADRAFPVEAASISSYMKYIPQQLRDWPFFIVGTNHLKPSINQQTKAKERNKPGGRAISFQETYEIELKHRLGPKTSHKKYADYEVNELTLETWKNSDGTTHRSIDVDVIWIPTEVHDPDLNRTVIKERCIWDWYGANIQLLLKMQKQRAVKDVVDLVKHPNRRVVWSKALGISKDSPATFAEAGRAIQENEQILEALRDIFLIRRRRLFKGGDDYDKQTASSKAQYMKKSKKATKKKVAKAPKKRMIKKKRRYIARPSASDDPIEF